MNSYRFFVFGDEKRQKYLPELLAEKMEQMSLQGKWKIQAVSAPKGDADRNFFEDLGSDRSPGGTSSPADVLAGTKEDIVTAVLLPVPQTKLYLEAVIDRLEEGWIVFGCNFPPKLAAECTRRKILCVDYMKVKGVAEKNAVATAEGAIVEALTDACVTIQGSRCLVTGYGCCGQVLAKKLLEMNAHVTVMERKSEKRSEVKACGGEAVSFDTSLAMEEFDYIFNTVPALVLTETFLSRVQSDVRIIDIASRPGGVDFDYCQKNGINAKLCLGLPGKYAPKSSAGILVEVIGKTILGEQ